MPGLWEHKWQPVQFTLVVDNFGVKYLGGKHVIHLKQTLEENYKVAIEWDGKMYILITLDWDYIRRQVHMSLPKYTDKALKQFNNKQKKKENQSYPSVTIIYGSRKQYSTQPSSVPPLDKKGKKFIQQVCGKQVLGRAVDSTLLCPISAITSQSANPTK